MKNKRWVAGAAMAMTFGAPAAAQAADTLYGVTAANGLVSFSSDSPQNVAVPLAITGLAGGETIKGIDVRPATGQIYALGSTGVVYVIDPRTAAATRAFPVTLRGDNYGIDFNPTVDKLRLVSDGEDNQRLNPDSGGTVAGPATDGGDSDITPAGDVVAAAYTKNVNGRQAGAATQLYTIDATTDTLNLQNPPNDGTQVAVGPLGIDVTAAASFDIPAAANVGYAALTSNGSTSLYTIDLATGAATLVGPIGSSSPVTGISAAKQDTPLFGLTAPDGAGAQTLLTFGSSAPRDTAAPQAIPVLARRGVSGLAAGDPLVGIDTRPADGRVYGFSQLGNVYVIDTETGRATRTASPTRAVTGTTFGVDFNPVPNRLRVVSDAEENLRLNPDDATGATNLTDGAINPAGSLVGAAYTNAFPQANPTPAPATAANPGTTLYTVDSDADVINRQDPPNAGTQVQLSPLGIDVGAETGYDIAPQDNAGFLAAQDGAATRSTLYRLESGATATPGPLAGVTAIGVIGADATGFVVRGLTAASPGSLGVAATTASAAESSGTVQIAIARSSAVGTATVNYAVAPGATAAGAVAASSGAVTFNPGETIKSVPVSIVDDATDEDAATATITLSRAAGGYRLGDTVTTLTITDDDAPVTPAPGQTTTVTTPAPAPLPPVTIPGTTVVIPAPVPGLIADRGRPVVLVYAPDRKLRTLRASGVPVVVSTNEAARIDLTLRLGSTVLGQATVVARSTAVVKTQVRLTAAGRRAVGTTRTRRLTATAVVTDVAGNVTTSRGGFRGTAPARRR